MRNRRLEIIAATLISAASILGVVTCVADEDLGILAIKKEFQEINKKNLKEFKVERTSDHSSEGEVAQAFLQHEKIRLIEVEYLAESGRTVYEYYYLADGTPFFVLETETDYSYPHMQGPSNGPNATSTTTESRFYFEKENLIRWLEGLEQIAPKSKRFRERGKEIYGFAKKAYGYADEELKSENSKAEKQGSHSK